MRSDDPFIRALQDLMVADRDNGLAEAQRLADEAKAAGHETGYRDYMRQVAWYEANPFAFEKDTD
jgi:hypothetical protein